MSAAGVTPIYEHGRGVRNVVAALKRVGSKQRGKAWTCPAHDDRTPSLGVDQGEAGALVTCRAGCPTDAVLAALKLDAADLFDQPRAMKRSAKPKRQREQPKPWPHDDVDVAATHRYERADGVLLFEVVRFTDAARDRGLPKCLPRFYQGGRWYQGMGPAKSEAVPLYREREAVAELEQGGTVYVTEGEGDADAIVQAGGVACCNVGGAGKFLEHHARTLADAVKAGEPSARLVLVPDRDAPGEQHAGTVYQRLRDAGAGQRVLEVKRAAAGKDARDHLEAGHDLAELEGIDADTLPGVRPRLRVATFDEIAADTVPDALIERLLFEESPTLYCGLPKRGKSFSALQAAVCLATGTPFLGLEVRRSRVLYLSWELAIASLRERMVAVARDVGLPDPLPLMRDKRIALYAHRRRTSADPIDLATDEGWTMLRELREDADADMLVLDTVSKVAGLEMKDTTGWADLLTRLNGFCRDQRVAVLAIDHANRARMEENASVVAMGSQSKGAAVPAIVKLTETKDDDPRDKRWKLEVDSWYGDGGAPIWFQRPPREGSDELGVGCVVTDPPEERSSQTSTDRAEAWLREHLAQGRQPKQRVLTKAAEAGFPPRTVERAFPRIGGVTVKGFQGAAQWELPEA